MILAGAGQMKWICSDDDQCKFILTFDLKDSKDFIMHECNVLMNEHQVQK